MDAKPLRLTTGSLQVYAALENPETCRQGEKCFPEIVNNSHQHNSHYVP